MEQLIALMFVTVIGSFVTTAVMMRKKIGTLRIDKSDPTDAPYIFLELKKNVQFWEKEQYVMLKVDAESYIPRK